MPSSTKLGSRPISPRMRSYSASESPCSRTISGVILVMRLYSGKGFDQALEQPAAVGAAKGLIHHPFGMGHQPQHIAFLAQNAGDVAGRTVGILALGITESDPVLAFQPVERLVIGEIAAFAMRHRKGHTLAIVIFAGEAGLSFFHFQADGLADEFQ